MKVHLLEKLIQDFFTVQLNGNNHEWYYPHSLVNGFHTEWQHLQERGLKATYDRCLRNEISHRWWKRERVDAKEMMLLLIDADPELAAIAWKDLAQSQANLDGRISRFTYYCEQLLDLHRAKHINSIETYHHQDAAMLSLYLAGIFPEKYTLYPGLEVFQNYCKAVGSPDIPKVDDLVRYTKVTTIIFNFLKKNELFEKLINQRNSPPHKIPCLPFQITYEIVCFNASVK